MENDASAFDLDAYRAGGAASSDVERGDAGSFLPLAAVDEKSAPAIFPPGSIWDGRYRVIRLIGEGGMGNVLLAADLAAGESQVALKVLQPRHRAFATPYFMREYAIQRRLRHPCIARACALGIDLQDGEEVPYFTMPFVAGTPLVDLMTEPLPLASVWKWMVEVLQALDAMHRAGFVHRDVKPGNILIDRRATAGPEARLIDFGIATELTADIEDYFIGTPMFSAPERLYCEPHDVRSDLYSVGLMMHELIEGAPPWHDTDPESLLHYRRTIPALPISNPECPPALRALVAEMLQLAPEKRPPSAAAVIERIEKALGRSGLLESEAGFADRLRGLPVPSPSYAKALETDGQVVLVHAPEGHSPAELLELISDRHALGGARVVQVRLEGKAGPPLHEIEGALDVFRRLRTRGENITQLRGLAGAATMLTRLHRKTVLVIEGLEHADEATLTVLGQAFVGAFNANLSVVASVASGNEVRAPAALRAFQAEGFVTHIRLDGLSADETRRYLADALGPYDVPPASFDLVFERCDGRPALLCRILAEAFAHGDLVRHAGGYDWRSPPTREALALLFAGYDGEQEPLALAERLVLAGRNLEAAPLLARAARTARDEGREHEAGDLIKWALELVDDEEDPGDARLVVLAAALDHACALGDDDGIVMAADRLFAAAVDAAHLPSIERALVAHIDQADVLWDAARANVAIDRLLLFQQTCGAAPTLALKSWARGLAAALAGDFAQVVECTNEGLDVGHDDAAGDAALPAGDQSSVGRWARAKLLALRAEMAVRSGVVSFAPRALALFEKQAHNQDPRLPTGGRAARLRVALLRAMWLRRSGDLRAARAVLEPFTAKEGSAGSPRTTAALELELAEQDQALGRCDDAIRRAIVAIALAENERNVAVAFAAEGVLADAFTRKGQPERQLERLERMLEAPPQQVPANVVLELKLRWLSARLGRGEGATLLADAASLTREAASCHDFGALGRASFVAAQAALRARRPLDALRYAERVADLQQKRPNGAPPKHAIEWLLASIHYELKWFKSASKLSSRAMESLRMITFELGQGDRERWLLSGDNVLTSLFR